MTGAPSDGTHSPGALYGFSFVAPAGTAIVGVDRSVEGVVTTEPGGPPPWHWTYGEYGTREGDDELVELRAQCWNCGPFQDSTDYPLPHRLSRIVAGLGCAEYNGSTSCSADGSHFILRRIALHLEDRNPPRVLAGSGTLLDAGAQLRGERNLTLNLRDAGSGLLKVRLEADGQKLSELPVGDPRGTCKPPYVAPVPCSLAATIDVPVDTTRLSDGAHEVSVRVFDATGVNAAVYGPIRIDVDNIPEPAIPGRISCPLSAPITVSRRLHRRVVRFGATNWLTGRVRGPASAMRGARVVVIDESDRRTPVPAAKIRPRGRFRLRLRAVAPAKVRPVVLSNAGVPQACGRRVTLEVRAGLRFHVAPRRLRNGQSILMTGRLRALPVPTAGKTVAVQARAHGQATWTTVSVMKSDPRGRFQFRYRFRRTFQRTTYEFRAVAPRERTYPYLRGWSPLRRAIVLP
jgi:hypothetical protein